ncbi:hypothetical protein COM46_21640 [Bacillus pseudomycoides]|nr:site-specific integrase [Bacillus pseudomycoides]PGD73684.1 hypothetical protein COM46_21640 [Bacillus pseudomycoides]
MSAKEFQDTVQQFASFLSEKGRKPSTIKRYLYDIEDFGHWLQKSKKLLISLVTSRKGDFLWLK